MASYNFRKGKERIETMLDNDLEVIEVKQLPKDDSFTFNNGYYGWVTGIFVDMRNSSDLFADEDKEKVSKVVRSFTSEVVTAHFPCRGKGGFFLPLMSGTCHNDLWLNYQPPIIHKEIHGK